MTPRREELTPKLVYFYEEMIRRCRKIDQKHLFLLNGTQFSSLTYFFDHEFDPEYHNWGISLHAYEMVFPVCEGHFSYLSQKSFKAPLPNDFLKAMEYAKIHDWKE